MSTEMKEAMSKMADLISKAPEDKKRDIGNFLAGCVAGLEIAVGGSKEERRCTTTSTGADTGTATTSAIT